MERWGICVNGQKSEALLFTKKELIVIDLKNAYA